MSPFTKGDMQTLNNWPESPIESVAELRFQTDSPSLRQLTIVTLWCPFSSYVVGNVPIPVMSCPWSLSKGCPGTCPVGWPRT